MVLLESWNKDEEYKSKARLATSIIHFKMTNKHSLEKATKDVLGVIGIGAREVVVTFDTFIVEFVYGTLASRIGLFPWYGFKHEN